MPTGPRFSPMTAPPRYSVRSRSNSFSVRWPSNTARWCDMARQLRHVDPAAVTLQDALDALADPVRRSIVQTLAGEPDFSRACGTFDLPVSKATASHHFA